MSVQAMRWARRQRTGSTASKAVLLVLADMADRTSHIARPTQRTLAEETEMDQRSVRRQLDALKAAGLIDWDPGRGRGANRYRLAVDRPDTPQGPAVVRQPSASLRNTNEAPERRTTNTDQSPQNGAPEPVVRHPDPVVRQAPPSDQPQREQNRKDRTELQEAAPPPPAREGARRAHARGGGEIVSAAELNATATDGRAYVIVSAWSQHNPGLTSGARRKLNRAVDQLLRQGALPELIPDALDEAHQGRWKHPAGALPSAYDDVRRRRYPPARGSGPASPGDAAIQAFLNGSTPSAPRAIGGP